MRHPTWRWPEASQSGVGSTAQWLIWVGTGFVVLGGLVAAVTGPLAWPKGSWAAAYLVLVCGVAQQQMGLAVRGGTLRLSDRGGRWLSVGWNAGNAAVVVGTLTASPYVVDAGGIVLITLLAGLLWVVVQRGGSEAELARPGMARWSIIALLVVLIVSIPVGLVLAHLRAG